MWVKARKVSEFKKGDRVKYVWDDRAATFGKVSNAVRGVMDCYVFINVTFHKGFPDNFVLHLDEDPWFKRGQVYKWVP